MKKTIEGFIKELTSEGVEITTIDQKHICGCSCGSSPSFVANCGTSKNPIIVKNIFK